MKMDKYYTDLLQRTNMETVVAAGWFDEELSQPLDEDVESYSTHSYTTPLDQISSNDEEGEVAVLYYTGCFAPIHEGHLTVMRLAKETVEQKTGLPVVAGYFAPDHDGYVSTKTGDDAEYVAAERVSFIQQTCEEEDWMQVDVWPSLYAPTDLNFTTLYDRFTKYVQHWLPNKKVRIYYVFGGDNYRFANTFTKYGQGVCVPREGVEMDKTLLLPNERVLWSEKSSTSHSSTAIRAARNANPEKEAFYVLRNDLPLAFPEPPNPLMDSADIGRVLVSLLSRHTGMEVQEVNVLEQVKEFRSEKPFISLDCFLETEHKLELTRVFVAGDKQKFSKLHTNRVGTAPIVEQISWIPAGVYDLVDDDIATGATMHTVETLLNQYGIQTGEFKSLLDSYGDEVFDVLDMRDFVLGAKHGGLTVRTVSGETTRVMYAAPYVNLVTRAKMDPEVALNFSLSVWRMNAAIYKETGVTVKDIAGMQDYSLFGFHSDMLVEELCRKHIAMMLSRNLR